MELVILSTVAAVVILLAELRDLIGPVRNDRSTPVAGASRAPSAAELAPRNSVANDQTAAPRHGLGRAA